MGKFLKYPINVTVSEMKKKNEKKNLEILNNIYGIGNRSDLIQKVLFNN